MDVRRRGSVRNRTRPRCRKLSPRHLPEPDRDHQRGADDGCLLVNRHAGRLPPLVFRQAVPDHRATLPPRSYRTRIRTGHQLEPVHCLPNGGKHADVTGIGDCTCMLRTQFLLQRQLSVQDVDGRKCNCQLSAVREEIRRAMRRTIWRRRNRITSGFMPRTDELRRRSISPPGFDFRRG